MLTVEEYAASRQSEQAFLITGFVSFIRVKQIRITEGAADLKREGAPKASLANNRAAQAATLMLLSFARI